MASLVICTAIRTSTMSSIKLIITLILLSDLTQAISFCIESSGNDSEQCLRDIENNNCCRTLGYLLHSIEDSHNVHIQVNTDTKVGEVITVQGTNNLTIQGASKLVCTNESSGFHLTNVSSLLLKDLVITNCSMLQESTTLSKNSSDGLKDIWCAVYITESSDIALEGVNIASNGGTGLVLYNVSGSVQISHSYFVNNMVQNDNKIAGGGGLSIEYARGHFETSYTINNSTFAGNYALEPDYENSRNTDNRNKNNFQRLGKGGGLCFILREGSYDIVLKITSCKFIDNMATMWGGGVYLSMQDGAANNTISVSDSIFEGNNCSHYGGGGVKITLISYHNNLLMNTITFQDCDFTNNTASQGVGGGLLLVSSRRKENIVNDSLNTCNTLKFTSCRWSKNSAKVGSAVDIYPAIWDILGNGLLPVPVFVNCTFIENYVMENSNKIHDGIKEIKTGRGTFVISNFEVKFEGVHNFTRNNGSAVYMQSGIMNIQENSEIQFEENTAKVGAAVALFAFSVIYVSENSSISFVNNVAKIKGGAVYVKTIDVHEEAFSNSCFMQVQDRVESVNVKIKFYGNMALNGRSVYAVSLKPCIQEKCNKRHNSMDYFNCVADVIGLNESDIATGLDKHEYEDEQKEADMSQLVPGKPFRIPIVAKDELKKPVTLMYNIFTQPAENFTMKLDEGFISYVTNQTIHLYSENDAPGKLLMDYDEKTTLSIDINTVTECPLGYANDGLMCVCHVSKFKGIWFCNHTDFTASILGDYWIGLCDNNIQCTGHCASYFCVNNASTKLSFKINETDKLCNKNRTGKLCGKCVTNHSVFYHSPSYRCDSNALCKYGMLFYILAEIVPLTIVFTVIILCNISFTSGTINGVILYAQIFDSLIMDFSHFNMPHIFQVLTDIYGFIYTTTNLNYFTLEELSFCLWPGATTLDIIAMKYVTIVYALLLILLTVFLLNTVTCKRLCVCWRPHNLKTAVIHGFSAFLVMCYSQCAKVSFMLLTPTTLSEYGLKDSDRVIFFSGENKFFDNVHIRYGVPALFFMLLIVILPPLALVLYPLSFKVLGLCHLSELKVVNWIANRIPVQFFDSFQSCYKDNFRFFSGLFFFYRTVPLLLYATADNLIHFYLLVEVFLILALVLNATLQPYKKHWHNVADSLIFTNLAIINVISLYNFQKFNDGKDDFKQAWSYIEVTTSVQLVLIYLPLVYVLLCLCWLAVRWVRKKVKEWKLSRLDYSQGTLLDSTVLPPLRNTDITEHLMKDHP